MEIAKPVFKFIAEILMISPIDSIKNAREIRYTYKALAYSNPT